MKISLFIIFLSCCLFIPVQGSSAPLGQIIAGGDAVVNGVLMPRGGTVFVGDRVQAAKESTVLQIQGGGKVEVLPGSELQLSSPSELAVTRGQVAYYFPSGAAVRLDLPKGTVDLEPGSARYLGTVTAGQEADEVRSMEGQVRVTSNQTGEAAVLESGQGAQLSAAPQTAVTGQGEKRKKSCEELKDLVILYTTDDPSIPLKDRQWLPVTKLSNGFQDDEYLDAEEVLEDGRIVGENHISDIPDFDGWASLMFDRVTATGIAIEFRSQKLKQKNMLHVNEFEAYLDEQMVREVVAAAWSEENRHKKAEPALAVDGDKSTATWSTQPDNIDPGHLAIGFLQSQDINRIRLWKDCADPALYLWHGNKRALTLFLLGAGGIATGIIIWKIIKDDDPASPS